MLLVGRALDAASPVLEQRPVRVPVRARLHVLEEPAQLGIVELVEPRGRGVARVLLGRPLPRTRVQALHLDVVDEPGQRRHGM